jgi:TetR/AcrR family transcriptional regulator, cholesterol catabolism regulator
MRQNLTQRGKDRKRQIVERAADLFAEQGYDATSVADIVESLGVGKGVFYWYFSSKDELLLELLRVSHHDLRRRQQLAIEQEDDPVRRAEVGIRTSMQWFLEHRKYFSLFQFAANSERFNRVLRAGNDVANSDAVRHVKDAIGDGYLADYDTEMVAYAVMGVIDSLTRAYILDRPEDAERAADAAVAFCLKGLVGA